MKKHTELSLLYSQAVVVNKLLNAAVETSFRLEKAHATNPAILTYRSTILSPKLNEYKNKQNMKVSVTKNN
jgi:hypothetical protein